MPDVPLIAVVDDDPSIRRSVAIFLQTTGHRVRTFASGREFLALMPAPEVACVLLDVHMPEMNGFDLQALLKVPVVFMTGHVDEATQTRLAQSGVAHLQKPFDEVELLDAIRRAVATDVSPKNPSEGALVASASFPPVGARPVSPSPTPSRSAAHPLP